MKYEVGDRVYQEKNKHYGFIIEVFKGKAFPYRFKTDYDGTYNTSDTYIQLSREKELLKTAKEKIKEVTPIKIPWEVMRFFVDSNGEITFSGDQASFGEDYGTLEELRVAITWFVKQFGGKVVWDEN